VIALLPAVLGILTCWLAGSWLSDVIPLPASLLGMALLFIYLSIRSRVPPTLNKLSRFLLLHLSLFFVPATVGAILYIDLLKQQIWLFILAIFLSTLLSLVLTAKLAIWFQHRAGKNNINE
jgi:holin-like protein